MKVFTGFHLLFHRSLPELFLPSNYARLNAMAVKVDVMELVFSLSAAPFGPSVADPLSLFAETLKLSL